MKTRLIVMLILGISSLYHACVFAKDVKGSKDDPLLGRFQGSEIRIYKHFKYDEIPFITGPYSPKTNKIEKLETIGGDLTIIGYYIPKGSSYAQLEHNYIMRLNQKGFTVDYKCQSATKECSSGEQAPVFFKQVRQATGEEDGLDGHYQWDPWSYRFISAHLDGPNGKVYAIVEITKNPFGEAPLFVYVTVLRQQAMKYTMVDAKKMAKSITDSGHIALYGIHFDTAKAIIKPDSEKTIQQIATLLKNQPALKLAIVGHTDNQGTLDYNMSLSKKRADAVRLALIKQFGIAENRLLAWGAGYLAPVASNHTEAGRAKNRRVELVEQ